MAWHCGRILGRRLSGAASDLGRSWKPSAKRGLIAAADAHNSNSRHPGGARRKFGVGRFETAKPGRSGSHGSQLTGAGSSSSFHSVASQPAVRRAAYGDDEDPLRSRRLHSSSVESTSSACAARAVEATAIEHVDTRAVSGVELTDDGEILYSKMTSKELLVTLCNLQLLSYEALVELSLKVLNSRLLRWPVTSTPMLWLIKRTTFSHFCAGEDTVEAGQTLSRMWELGLRGVLDYSLEDAVDEDLCDDNCAGFLTTIASSRDMPAGSVSFICVKISAICPVGLLERVSDHLRWQLRNPECKLLWKQDGLPVLAPESPTYQTQSAPEPLDSKEEAAFLRAQQRLRLICQSCEKENVPILLDAEYTNIQPAIDYMTYVAVFEFNRGGRPIVYVTMQAYMKDTASRLSLAMAEASRRNAFLGLKLVRGAYIVRETALASSLGFPSPIHDSAEATHDCYNACASRMLHRVTSGNSSIVIATHNSNSGRILSQRAYELGLDKADPRVHFAQLKGMADGLSLALVHAGLNVSKYIPFGPVIHVVPYLVRRAHENRGVLGNTSVDRQRMRKELGRRLKDGTGLT